MTHSTLTPGLTGFFSRLPIDLTPLITSLLRECTPESCPEMKAGEWQYICVANHQGQAEEDGKGAMQEVSPIIW